MDVISTFTKWILYIYYKYNYIPEHLHVCVFCNLAHRDEERVPNSYSDAFELYVGTASPFHILHELETSALIQNTGRQFILICNFIFQEYL